VTSASRSKKTVLPYFFDTPGIDGFVLDYANRDMAGIEFMKNLPKDKHLQVGVLDIRTNAIERPEQIVARIKKVTAVVPADRLYLSSDCGMKPLARMVAKMKLKALAEAAAIVRREIGGA
jgi:5-methyltetrahydropteroyltriglutamate--homocysteine methyltransferase